MVFLLVLLLVYSLESQCSGQVTSALSEIDSSRPSPPTTAEVFSVACSVPVKVFPETDPSRLRVVMVVSVASCTSKLIETSSPGSRADRTGVPDPSASSPSRAVNTVSCSEAPSAATTSSRASSLASPFPVVGSMFEPIAVPCA